jgi:hypothetical protein
MACLLHLKYTGNLILLLLLLHKGKLIVILILILKYTVAIVAHNPLLLLHVHVIIKIVSEWLCIIHLHGVVAIRVIEYLTTIILILILENVVLILKLSTIHLIVRIIKNVGLLLLL